MNSEILKNQVLIMKALLRLVSEELLVKDLKERIEFTQIHIQAIQIN